ncbi:MAG: hypothetical protein QM760_07380 [Nibricoccus sp.]
MNLEIPVEAPRVTEYLLSGKRLWLLGLMAALVCAAGVAKAADEDEDDGPKDEVAPEMRELRQKLSAVKEWQGVWERSRSGSRAGPTGGEGR